MGQFNPKHRNWLDAEQVESSAEKKDLGSVVVEKLGMKWQRAIAGQKANCVLGCTKISMANRSREAIVPIYSVLMNVPAVLLSALGPNIRT